MDRWRQLRLHLFEFSRGRLFNCLAVDNTAELEVLSRYNVNEVDEIDGDLSNAQSLEVSATKKTAISCSHV